MQNYFVQARRKVYRYIYRLLYNQREINRLSANPDPVAQAIVRALQSIVTEQVLPEEQAWITKIEVWRAALNDSDEMLEEVRDDGVRRSSTVGSIAREASIRKLWAMLMFKLVRELEPENVIELGTCVGVSGAYQAAALHLNGHGRITTMEKSPTRVALATSNFKTLGLTNIEAVPGKFSDTLGGVLERSQPVHYAFIDGHHDEQATIDYFHQVLPYIEPGRTVLLFDDIAWSDGMRRAWQTIANDPHTVMAVDLFKIGICVPGKSTDSKQIYKIALD